MKLTSCVQQNDNSVFCELDQQTVLLNVAAGKYHGFNEVASRIWQLMSDAIEVSKLCDELATEFEVPREKCETEVLVFLQNLKNAELISVS